MFITYDIPSLYLYLLLLLASFPALNGFDGCGVGGNILALYIAVFPLDTTSDDEQEGCESTQDVWLGEYL